MKLLRTARLLLAFLAGSFLAACGKGTPITSGTPTPPPTPPPSVATQYPIPTASSQPVGIALGADSNLWFTEFGASKIGQLNTAGRISESVTPTKGAGPNGIASGPGPSLNLWFTETNIGRVAQITIAGPPYTEFVLPNPAAKPVGIALGADGNMWVTDPGTESVWRVRQIKVKPFVIFTQYHLTGAAHPLNITNGPDGALWFTEPGTNSIGRIPISGFPITQYPLTPANSGPAGIAAATDNAIWFTQKNARQLVRMATSGVVTASYPLNAAMTPNDLIQGVDGNFYFTDTTADKIGQFFFRSHHVAFFSIPTANSEPTALTLGPDNQIYLTETAGNKIAQFRYFTL